MSKLLFGSYYFFTAIYTEEDSERTRTGDEEG